MPTFAELFYDKEKDKKEGPNEEEVLKLIAFIKSLQPGQTPTRVEESAPPAQLPGEKTKATQP